MFCILRGLWETDDDHELWAARSWRRANPYLYLSLLLQLQCVGFVLFSVFCFMFFFSLLIDWEHKRFSLLTIKMQEGLYLCCRGPASMHQIKNKSLFCFGIWQWRCSWWWSWFRLLGLCRYLFMDTLLYLVLQCEAWTLLEPHTVQLFSFSPPKSVYPPPFQDLFNCSHVKSFVVMCRTSAD